MSPTGSLGADGFDWHPTTGDHRHVLEQTFDREGPSSCPLVVVALNPAANTIAGYRRSDTCRKAKLWASPRGFDGVIYLNLFTALEVASTVLHRVESLVDDEADRWFRSSAERSTHAVVAAWGTRPTGIPRQAWADRVAHARSLLAPRSMVCMGINASGDPTHPRMWRSSSEPRPFDPDPATGRAVASARARLLVRFQVEGRPAAFATRAEAPWKALVREAVERTGGGPWPTERFSVRIEFRTPEPANATEVWDLDNLIKPTLDAMEGVFGRREWRGVPQPADDRVDHIDARKSTVRAGEAMGATIEVWTTASRRGPA